MVHRHFSSARLVTAAAALVLVLLPLVDLAGFHGSGFAKAQGIAGRPARSAEAAAALTEAEWREIEPGLSALRATTALGTRLTALRISPERFAFSVHQQRKEGGERVESIAKRADAVVAVNGGFFSVSDDGKLQPVGLLKDDGEVLTPAWQRDGGFLAIRKGRPFIRPTRKGMPGVAEEILQSKPVLIEPGKRWSMRVNRPNQEKRSLVCLLPDGDVVLFVVNGGGLSLFEAGWLFRSRSWGGYFDCDSAIALDGGGSTQLYVSGAEDYSIAGETPVQNALVITRR